MGSQFVVSVKTQFTLKGLNYTDRWSCRQGPSLSEADYEMVLQTWDPIIVSSKGMLQLISALFDPS